jgi:hypothetical protein
VAFTLARDTLKLQCGVFGVVIEDVIHSFVDLKFVDMAA